MRRLVIEEVAQYVPSSCIQVEQAHDRLGLSVAQARVFSRMYELPQCPVAQGPELDLLLAPCQVLMAAHPQVRDDIVLVVYAHTGAISGVWGQSLAQQLVSHLGLRNALALGSCSNNCVGVFSAMTLANAYLAGQAPGKRALIVVGEKADNVELRVVSNVAIVGDGAAAALVSSESKAAGACHGGALSVETAGRGRVTGQAIHYYPGYAEGIWLSSTSPQHQDFERHYQQRLKAVMEAALVDAEVEMDALRWVIPHNVNIWMWRKAAQYMALPIEKVFLDNIRRTAHCLGADMFINFDTLGHQITLVPGDTVLMVSAGVGGVFGAAVLQI